MLTFEVSQQKMIHLKSKELFFLAGVLGSERLLGVEDPFQGYLAEELTREWEEVKTSLLEKGYLRQTEEGGELAIPPTVFSRVAIAGLSRRACLIEYTRDGRRFEGYLHCTNEKVVELAQSDEDEYRLSELGDVESACETIIEKMGWREQVPAESPALMFSQKRFHEINKLADKNNTEVIRAMLTEASGDPEGADMLTKTLCSKVSEGELTLLVWNGQEWESQRAAFTVCDSMSWLYRMSSVGNGDWLIATLTTQDQFLALLLDWLRQSAGTEER